ncbi:hCG1650455, isoform CRA_a [Homo sapiens]|nr:chromosome 21 open reading frame 109 [Homo sapiens]EAX09916.1 hCG1650455, isoform CRA_a [Homo sapiens]
MTIWMTQEGCNSGLGEKTCKERNMFEFQMCSSMNHLKMKILSNLTRLDNWL